MNKMPPIRKKDDTTNRQNDIKEILALEKNESYDFVSRNIGSFKASFYVKRKEMENDLGEEMEFTFSKNRVIPNSYTAWRI